MGLATQTQVKTASEVVNASVDFSRRLDQSELLTGTPTITATGLTLANQAVSTTQLVILGEDIGIGKAVTWNITGGTANTNYTVQIAVTTDSSPAQTLYFNAPLRVVADTE